MVLTTQMSLNQKNSLFRPCRLVGVAYNLVNPTQSKKTTNIIDEKTWNLWPKEGVFNYSTSSCLYSLYKNPGDLQRILYTDPAIMLTHEDFTSMRFSGCPIRDTHQPENVGSVDKAWMEGNNVMIEASVYNPETAYKIRNGTYTGLSIGYQVKAHNRRVLGKELVEISVCENPVFEECRINVAASRTQTPQAAVATGSSSNALGGFVSDHTSNQMRHYGLIEIKSIKDLPANDKNNILSHDKSSKSFLEVESNASPFVIKLSSPMEATTTTTYGTQQQQQQFGQIDEGQEVNYQNREENNTDGDQEEDGQKPHLDDTDLRQAYEELKRKYEEAQKAMLETKNSFHEMILPRQQAFTDFVKVLRGNEELSEEVVDIIQKSYSTPGLGNWTQVLDDMRTAHTKLSDENAELKRTIEQAATEFTALRNENESLKRKTERHHKSEKFMKTNDGKRVRTMPAPAAGGTKRATEPLYSDGTDTASLAQKLFSKVPVQKVSKIEKFFVREVI